MSFSLDMTSPIPHLCCFLIGFAITSLLAKDYEKDDTCIPPLVYADDSLGFLVLGKDGVLRSCGIDGAVVDAARLNRSQIDKYISMHEGILPEWPTDPIEMFYGIDGLQVPEEQLLHPPSHVMPVERLEAWREEAIEIAEAIGMGPPCH